MQFKRRLVGRQVSLLSMFLHGSIPRAGETPSEQNIMKYQLHTISNASKKNR